MKSVHRLLVQAGSSMFALGAVVAGVAHPSARVEEKVDFSREVLPILSENCFLCHGPDATDRQAGLRLDLAESAYGDRGGRFAIVPGKPEESLLLQRVSSHDAPMPPLSSGKSLTAEQKLLLRRWIEQGAEYRRHWAFEPLPASVGVPQVRSSWIRDPLDAFVLARLRDEGMSPSAEASRERWLRRVSYDLTGLPPSPEEVSSFLDDKSSTSYERVVDRLLSSPHYGERMAVPWLDSARYADSYGYQSDLLASFWPYRDWVVSAFNSGMGYDEFIRLQIAGDFSESYLPTAFNRLHRMTNEGGSIAEEFRTLNAMDRTETFGTAMLGLTVGCARCHDHKYDPLKQSEYYSLLAYFNSIDERGLYNGSDVVPSPTVMLPTEAQKDALSRSGALVESLRSEKSEFGDAPLVRLSFDDGVGSGGYGGLKAAPGHEGGGVVFSGDDGLAVRGLPDVDVWDAFSWSFWIRDDEPVAEPRVLLHKTGGTDTGFSGMDLMLVGGRLQARIYRDWPGNAIAVESVDEVPSSEWAQVVWSYGGDGIASSLRLYLNGREMKTRTLRDFRWKQVRAFGDLGGSGGSWAFGSRFRCLGFKGGRLDDVAYWSHEYGSVGHSPAFHDAFRSLVQAENAVLEVPVMRELAVPQTTRLLSRGRYDAPAEEVERGVPSFLLPMSSGSAPDRRGLVSWLLRSDHPLTSRVFVNRIWQMMFGTGLVKTSENFGVLGDQPSHPELLDYLSRWFIESGWDIKALVKKIALSATYRQDSALTETLKERDPENRLLARGPSYRLDAEMVRDTALYASGLMDERLGGPPVNPYQPSGIWTANNAFSPPFVQSKGKDLYRRSLYTTWKRTTPAPDMLAFDASGREVCVMRRARTSSPMQALVTLNDVQYVEAARVLAERVLTSGSGIPEAFLRLTGRAPTSYELVVLDKCFEEQSSYFRGHLSAAIEFASTGDSKRNEDLRASQVAAMAVTVQTIMNMDAVVWQR